MPARRWVVAPLRRVAALGRQARAWAVAGVVRRSYGGTDVGDAIGRAARVPLLGGALVDELLRRAPQSQAEDAVARLAGGARARAARALAARLEQDGGIDRPLELAEERGDRAAAVRLAAQARLLRDGIAVSARAAPRYAPEARRVLYHAAQGLPHHSTGYCIRTHWLVRALRASGWDVQVHTRLGYPIDRWDYLGDRAIATDVDVDGVPYVLAPDRARGIGALDLEAYQAASAEALVRRAEALRPAVIHGASNWAVGLAGVEAARRLGLPSIYEVRGLWHQTVAAQRPAYLDSDHYRMIEKLEVSAALGADHVFAITGAVRDLLVGHGVPSAKISILPNAVDPDEFAPTPRDEALARELGLGGETVIGYVGSLKDFEGLDLLLHATAVLPSRRDLRLLFVGDGPAEGDLRRLARRFDLGDIALFTGRVPHARVRSYYSLIDVMAFPRKRVRVCETVSPLKPFEAMAMAKPIIVSDVPALAEIVRHGETGLVHRADDAASLAAALEMCVSDPALRRRLGDAARLWLTGNHTWSRVTDHIASVYRSLV